MIDTLNISELSDEVKNLKNNVNSIVPVPEPETTDAGKIIGVNESGEYELVDAPSGGGSYTQLVDYQDEYGTSATVSELFEDFIVEINNCTAPPNVLTLPNYKITIGGVECKILKFSVLGTGAIKNITLAYDTYNASTGTYDTTTFDYSNNGSGTVTITAKKVSYKTSGITVSDINSMPMLFMGTHFKLYKLG